MDTNPLHITLETLRSEREGAEHRAIDLSTELEHIGQRLTHLRGAIENIEALLGVPSVEDEAVLASDDDDAPAMSAPSTQLPVTPATVREIDFTNVQAPDPEPSTAETPRKRVPSTQWVAEVVNEIGQPADRGTIFDKFEELKGIPASWGKPRNAFNNALMRAADNDLIQKLNDDLFAPLSYVSEGATPANGGHDG